MKSIEKTLVDIQTESTYLWIRQKSHMKAVENIHTRVLLDLQAKRGTCAACASTYSI